METTQNTSTEEQGPESAPVESPKDEECTTTKEKHLEKAVACVIKELFPYAARFRHEVLTAALEEVSKTIKPADELLAMEERVRKICDGLDVKTKAVIAVLGELAVIEGYTIGVEYGSDILHGELRGKAFVDEALQQSPGDSDLAFLAKVYELARCITEAEDKILPREKAAEEETTPEEPQPKEETASEDEKPQLKEGATPITVLQKWLSKRGYAEKLTAVLLWQMLNKGDIYKKEGYCEGDIGNELFREYEQAVVDASQNEEYLKTADGEEIAVTGMVTGLLPMHV